MAVADVGAALSRALLAEGVLLHAQRLRADTRFFAEMTYCGERGIPHSVFLEWSNDDQDKALAWIAVRGQACGRCGTYPDEWVDPATGMTVGERPYTAEAIKCHGCSELEAELKDLRRAGAEGADLDGVTVRLRLFDPDRDDEPEDG